MKIFLIPLSWLFGWLTELRVWLYEKQIFKSYKLSAPVISVGNLTVGGTGKTPFVDVLIAQLEEKNLKVGVLTRGYGRKSQEIVEVQTNTSADICGDEPLWLKQRHPQAQIVVGANRRVASEKLKDVNVIILDDGMQHLEIARDLEITLIDASRGKDHYRLLPLGRAREKVSAMRRSDFAILTKTNLATTAHLDEMVDLVFAEGILDIIESLTLFDNCHSLSGNQSMNIRGKKVYLCSGIANPESFEQIVKSEGATVVGHSKLADHASIDEAKVSEIVSAASQAEMILITEKDAVKWSQVKNSNISKPVGVVSTKMTFVPELPHFYDLVSHHRY